MASDKVKGGAALVGSAAIIASMAALRGRKVQAVPETVVGLDQDTMNLLIAMAGIVGEIPDRLDELSRILQGMSVSVQGYAPNVSGITSGRVIIGAVNTSYQLPEIEVPDDMVFQIKGWPTNAGLIYVAESDPSARNIERVWPLLANEAVGYRVKNANAIWVSGTAAGDIAVFTVEQKGRAG